MMRFLILFLLTLIIPISTWAQLPIPANKPVDKNVAEGNRQYDKTPSIPISKPKPIRTNEFLSKSDVTNYKKIFEAQESGNWKQADYHISQLKNFSLRPYYLYQRYMHPTLWRSSYEDLYHWMNQYSDIAGAHDVYKLGVGRQSKGSDPLKKPQSFKTISGVMPELNSDFDTYRSKRRKTSTQTAAIKKLKRTIRSNLRRDRITISHDLLKSDPAKDYLDAAEYDGLRAQIAAGYLYLGLFDKAFDLSSASFERSGSKVPLAGWVSGLTSWRKSDFDSAYTFFQSVALSKNASNWTNAAGAFWASRAAFKLGKFDEVSKWLKHAAQYNRTFYGVLATRALGLNVKFNWDLPKYKSHHLDTIIKYPQARRAMQLSQIGEKSRASRELLRLHPENDKTLQQALLAFAVENELPSFQLKFASIYKQEDGSFYDAALYPIGAWVDKTKKHNTALIHAIIRQESRFDNLAENGASGALGLMQILPSTANHATKSKRYKGRGRHALKNAITNVSVGQSYINNLSGYSEIDNDLVYLVTAYNAGPGNLRKWKRNLSDIKDPLLFIESMPYAETRAYVERVLSNYWIYRMRLDQSVLSLNDIASGKWGKID